MLSVHQERTPRIGSIPQDNGMTFSPGPLLRTSSPDNLFDWPCTELQRMAEDRHVRVVVKP